MAVYLRQVGAFQVGAFDVMREWVEFTDPGPEDLIPYKAPVIPMVPCAHFKTDQDVEDLAIAMEERFATEFIGWAGLLQPCYLIFSELAANVVNHAQSDGGYVLAQQYNFRTGPVVDIAIADCGIGIRESLLQNPDNGPYQSDCEAIGQALCEGISAIRNTHRGYGLYYVADNVQIAENRSLTIRSGNGILTLRGDGTITIQERQVLCPGTIVNVRVPCKP